MIAASFVFILTGGAVLNLLIGFAGVIIFSGLTAYDIQNLKQMRVGRGGFGGFGGGFGRRRMQQQPQAAVSPIVGEKLAIYGALMLYLDFINLFVSLLRIFGGRR
jgi:FtsH-binding integral membrane protein